MEELEASIVINAIENYRKTLNGLIKTKKDLENFFTSDWCYLLLMNSKYDGEYMMNEICKQTGYEEGYKMASDLEVIQDSINIFANAMQKQKPKMVSSGVCPICKKRVSKRKKPYCSNCGQKLKFTSSSFDTYNRYKLVITNGKEVRYINKNELEEYKSKGFEVVK